MDHSHFVNNLQRAFDIQRKKIMAPRTVRTHSTATTTTITNPGVTGNQYFTIGKSFIGGPDPIK